jgi:hypothetical protein
MAQRNSRTQSSRRACCNDCASAPSELASRVFVNSRTNAGMITRSRKSLSAGCREAWVSQLVSDLRGSRLPSGARGISSSQTTKPSPCTRSDVYALAILREFVIPCWQQLGDCGAGSSHFRRQFFEPAAIEDCMDSCMVYVYSTMKRRLQRRNAGRDARTCRDSASPTVAHPDM